MATFVPFDLAALTSNEASLSDYELEHRSTTEIDRILFGHEHLQTNGFYDRPSRRLHLMYLHLYGTAGQQVRDVVAGVDQNDAYEELSQLGWGGFELDRNLSRVGCWVL